MSLESRKGLKSVLLPLQTIDWTWDDIERSCLKITPRTVNSVTLSRPGRGGGQLLSEKFFLQTSNLVLAELNLSPLLDAQSAMCFSSDGRPEELEAGTVK